MNPPHALSRRGVLGGAAGLSLGMIGAGGLSAPAEAARAAKTLSNLEAYLALRFIGPGRPGWWINRATVFAMPLGRMTVPLFDVIGLGRDLYLPQPDGTIRLTFDECGWYCAPGTTTPADTIVSPINGRTIKVKHYRSPQNSVVRDGNVEPERPYPAGVEMRTVRSALQQDGADVWMTDDIFVRSPRPVSPAALAANPTAGWNVQTSLATYSARARDLANHRRAWVPAACAYQTLASWRSWFDADEVPGAMSWRMHGMKVARVADIPDPILSLVRAEHATLLAG